MVVRYSKIMYKIIILLRWRDRLNTGMLSDFIWGLDDYQERTNSQKVSLHRSLKVLKNRGLIEIEKGYYGRNSIVQLTEKGKISLKEIFSK